MYHLRLIKSASYRGIVTATREKPDVYTEDWETVKAALDSGFFELEGGCERTGHLSKEQLMTWDIPTLTDLAKDMGIDISDLGSKEDLVNAISAEEVSIPDITENEQRELEEEMFSEEPEESLEDFLKEKTIPELRKIADQKGVNVKGLSKKDEIVAALVESDRQAVEARKAIREE